MKVKELREQLEKIEKLGYGNHNIIFIDSFDITHDFETGIHDIIETTEEYRDILPEKVYDALMKYQVINAAWIQWNHSFNREEKWLWNYMNY